MTAHVSSRVRQQVRRRAEGKYEYCLVHEEDGYVGYQIDHYGTQTRRRDLV